MRRARRSKLLRLGDFRKTGRNSKPRRRQCEQAHERQNSLRPAKSADDKEKSAKDDKKPEKIERKVIITNLDAKTKADLERMIKEKLKPPSSKMYDLHKIIQDSVDPAKMRQIQTKVHEMLRKTLDEKRKDMDKAFDEVRKAMGSLSASCFQRSSLGRTQVRDAAPVQRRVVAPACLATPRSRGHCGPCGSSSSRTATFARCSCRLEIGFEQAARQGDFVCWKLSRGERRMGPTERFSKYLPSPRRVRICKTCFVKWGS